jgi:predicted TIM-barrel fold metal-dependent hydrolase
MAQSESEGKSENTQSATDELRRIIARQHAVMALVHYLASEEYGAPPALHRSFINVFGMGLVKGIAGAVALGWIEQLDRAQGQNWVRLSCAGLYVATSANPFLEKP